MKRLFLVASLCIVALALVPVTSASASLEGTCVVNGTAKFTGGKLTEKPSTKGYSFESTSTVCHPTTGDPVAEGGAKSTTVTGGEGEKLACLGLEETIEEGTKTKFVVPLEGNDKTDGLGKLKVKGVPSGVTLEGEFDLDFKSKLGVVSLELEKVGAETVTASGTATFFTSAKEPAALCPTLGVSELEFTATATGKIG